MQEGINVHSDCAIHSAGPMLINRCLVHRKH
jgi:hypothetical protein